MSIFLFRHRMCQEVTRWSAALDLTRGWTLRDTLSTVAVSVVLLLFALLLSLQAVRLQRDSLDARSGEAASAPEITGLRRAAGALVLPPLAFFFRLALETWRSAPDPEGSARINAWASLLVLAAALLRYYDLTVIQPGPGRG